MRRGNIFLKPFLLLTALVFSFGDAAVVKRQSDFDAFGQIFHSIFDMFSTIGSEGGKFVSKQTEVNQPVLETVGNIGNTISRSDFVESVRGVPMQGVTNVAPQFIADNVALATNTMGLVTSVSCAVLCPDINNCTYNHCLP